MKQSKTIIIAAIIFSMLTTVFAMSGDGGNEQPLEQVKKKEATHVQSESENQFEKEVTNKTVVDEKQENADISEKSSLERFKASMEEKISKKIIVHKDKDGNAVDEEGQILVPAERIVWDKAGNETALDGWLKKTELSIEDYSKHYTEYLAGMSSILIEKGYKSLPWFVGGWYENRINLDKLDELQSAGFEVFTNIGKSDCNSFEGLAMTAEAVIIGEIIESKNIDINTTGFYGKVKIKVHQIIKDSELLAGQKVIEVAYSNGYSGYQKVQLNKKGVILLSRVTGYGRGKGFSILFWKLWEERNNFIFGKPMCIGSLDSISIDIFKGRVKELIRINDADNFFKRSWKEAKK